MIRKSSTYVNVDHKSCAKKKNYMHRHASMHTNIPANTYLPTYIHTYIHTHIYDSPATPDCLEMTITDLATKVSTHSCLISQLK